VNTFSSMLGRYRITLDKTHPLLTYDLDPVNKPKLREKYGILDDWVLPYKVRCAHYRFGVAGLAMQ